MTPPVTIEEVTHRYGERLALDRVSFEVFEGEIFGLLGPNGGGKTTLFRILSTALRPTGGRVRIWGEDVAAHPQAVRWQIGVVFQSPSLDGKLTVAENLRHHGHLYGLRARALEAALADLLSRFDLSDRADDLVETLSGGLKRRVEIAKALLHRPRLLLLDEPTTGLDPRARLDVWAYLRSLRSQEGVTVVFTTHFLDEGGWCDRLAILDQGHLVALDTPEALTSQVGSDVIVIETNEPETLQQQIRARFGIESTILDSSSICLREGGGAEFLAELQASFPGLMTALTLRRPTLEDVFIQRTGHRFDAT